MNRRSRIGLTPDFALLLGWCRKAPHLSLPDAHCRVYARVMPTVHMANMHKSYVPLKNSA
jgi:hypothetical protein